MNASRAMSSFVTVAGYEFSGPFKMSKYLHQARGVFVILDVQPDNSWTVIDVGTADDVRTAVEKHARGTEWNKHRRGELAAAALYSDSQADRDNEPGIEGRIRNRYHPPCG